MHVINNFSDFLKSSLNNPRALLKVNSHGELEEYSNSFKDRVKYTFGNFKVAFLNHFSSKKTQAAINYQVAQWASQKAEEFAVAHAANPLSKFGNIHVGMVTLPTIHRGSRFAKAELLQLLKENHPDSSDQELERLLPQASATLRLIEMRVYASHKGFGAKDSWQDFIGNVGHSAQTSGFHSIFADSISEEVFADEVRYKALAAATTSEDMTLKEEFETLLNELLRLDVNTVSRSQFKSKYVDRFKQLQGTLYGRIAKNNQTIKILKADKEHDNHAQIADLKERNHHMTWILNSYKPTRYSSDINEAELTKILNLCHFSTEEELRETMLPTNGVAPVLSDYLSVDAIESFTGPDKTIRFSEEKQAYQLVNLNARDSDPVFWSLKEARQKGLLHGATCQYLEASLLGDPAHEAAYVTETDRWITLCSKFRRPIVDGVHILTSEDHNSANLKHLEELLAFTHERILVMQHYRSTHANTPGNEATLAKFDSIITKLRSRHNVLSDLYQLKMQIDLQRLQFIGRFINPYEGVECIDLQARPNDPPIQMKNISKLLHNQLERAHVLREERMGQPYRGHHDILREVTAEENIIRQSLGMKPSFKSVLLHSISADGLSSEAWDIQNDLLKEESRSLPEETHNALFLTRCQAKLAIMSREDLFKMGAHMDAVIARVETLPIADIKNYTVGVHPQLLPRLKIYSQLLTDRIATHRNIQAQQQLEQAGDAPDDLTLGTIFPESLLVLFKSHANIGTVQFGQDLSAIVGDRSIPESQKFINYSQMRKIAMDDEYKALQLIFFTDLERAQTEEEVQAVVAKLANVDHVLQLYHDQLLRFPRTLNANHLHDLKAHMADWKARFTPELIKTGQLRVHAIKNPPPPAPPVPPILKFAGPQPLIIKKLPAAKVEVVAEPVPVVVTLPVIPVAPLKVEIEAAEAAAVAPITPKRSIPQAQSGQLEVITNALSAKNNLAISVEEIKHIYLAYVKKLNAKKKLQAGQVSAATSTKIKKFAHTVGSELGNLFKKSKVPAVAKRAEGSDLDTLKNDVIKGELSYEGALAHFKEYLQALSPSFSDEKIDLLIKELLHELELMHETALLQETRAVLMVDA